MGFWEERMNLDGKVAVVIGGGEGIGAAITMGLAGAGLDVAVCDREGPALEATGRSVEGMGRRAAAAGVACVAVEERGVGNVLGSDDWLVDAGFMAAVEHPIFGPLRQHGHHVLLSETPGTVGVSGTAGSATRQVLADAGYEEHAIDALIARGAVSDRIAPAP